MHRHHHCMQCGMHMHVIGICGNCSIKADQARREKAAEEAAREQAARRSASQSVYSSSSTVGSVDSTTSQSFSPAYHKSPEEVALALELEKAKGESQRLRLQSLQNPRPASHSSSSTNLFEVLRRDQEIQQRARQAADKEKEKEKENKERNLPQVPVGQKPVVPVNQDTAVYKALEKFSDAEIGGIYKKIVKLTNDFVNDCSNHNHIVNAFWNILHHGQEQVNQRKCLVEFAEALFDPKNKAHIEEHTSGAFSRYILNALSFLLLGIPAIVRAVDCYKTYGTGRFWLAPAEKLSVYVEEQSELKELTSAAQSSYNACPSG